MSTSKETEEKIQQLQFIEQSLQVILQQKQNIQMRIVEIDSALAELGQAPTAYKIIGTIMVAAKPDDIRKDLTEKKETAGLRLQSLEKQEKNIREKAAELQQEVLGQLKAGKNDTHGRSSA